MHCFMIQPYDEKFNKRYDEVFGPAIRGAKLKPYRVDKDDTVTNIVEGIESGILSSAVCLADITTDNPNVWYEVGFAKAANKPTVMVCSTERRKFPFDVRHLAIIYYSLTYKEGYPKLERDISSRLQHVVATRYISSAKSKFVEASNQRAAGQEQNAYLLDHEGYRIAKMVAEEMAHPGLAAQCMLEWSQALRNAGRTDDAYRVQVTADEYLKIAANEGSNKSIDAMRIAATEYGSPPQPHA